LSRATLVVVVLFVAAEIFLGGLLYRNYSAEVQQRLTFHSGQLDMGFHTLVQGYRQLAEVIFHQAIDRPEIADLVAAANTADPALQARLRGRLYRALYPTYELLRQRDIRVLQILLVDGRSFLRFNRPDLFDDPIAADRPLLAEVLASGEPGQAFENGRVYPGFRYAFPMFKDGRLVGVADFSAAFDAMHRVLVSREGAGDVFKQLLVRRDLMEAVAHPSALGLFRDTPIHAAFVTEDETSSRRDLTWMPTQPEYAPAIEVALGRRPAVRALLDAGEAGSVYQCLADKGCYVVSLQPVHDSRSRAAGYIVAYLPAPGLWSTRRQYLVLFATGSLLLLGAGTALRRWLVSRRRMQTISENMAEGMYVMDNQGRIVFTNPAAGRLLGHDAEALVGRSAHELFHSHCADEPVASEDCPIRMVPLRGATYKGDNELFRRRDGTCIHVAVTSSPLREEGRITGAVVMFRDVSVEHETRARLLQTDTAFRNLAEAVLVSDAGGTIQAVNHAFTSITGYSEEEVRGRNPRILASGRHDAAFYREMWETINEQGTWQGEIWNRRKNGEVYPEWLNITAIHDDQGKVASYVSVFSDITEMRRKEERLRELAFHDQLTGLPNRAYFQQLFQHAVRRAQRQGSSFALLYLDLDRFKQINDTLGHMVGDRLLQAVARRILDAVRAEDVVARLGGDELTVLLEDVGHSEEPARVARKLLEALREPFEIEGKQLHVTVSIGISLFPQDGGDTVTLLKNADAAMYLAKQRGRNDYSYFTASLAREVEDRFAVENDLRVALREDQLLLHYQPKVQAGDGRIVGLEALVRWRHPQRGLLGPGHFLAVATEAGLLPQITEWVVRRAARQAVAWQRAGLDPGRVAVNLDDQTLQGAGAPQRLRRWVTEEGAAPEAIELEITETVLLRRGALQPLWRGLVEIGFELSLDDFGTGESSLFRLKQLPVRTLKVDKAFVDEIDHEERDRAILRSIIGMARALGKRVLAEGVERPGQQAVLLEIGCDQVQGYYFAKPLDAVQMTALLHGTASLPVAADDDAPDRDAASVGPAAIGREAG
jgi:diguanylate cyclase (GGDEF)-like protein/PAS domain S-box-containing protein